MKNLTITNGMYLLVDLEDNMRRFIRGLKKRWSLERVLFDDKPAVPQEQRVPLRVIEGGSPRGSHY